MTRRSEAQSWLLVRIRTHGCGISKTITDTTTDHIVWAAHGIGAGTTIRITVRSTARITVLIIVLTTVHITILGAATHGSTADSMILGTTEDTGEDTMETIGDGTIHGITITTTADGITRHTITTVVRHISEAARREDTPTDSTESARAPNPMDSLQEKVLRASLRAQPGQAPEPAEEA